MAQIGLKHPCFKPSTASTGVVLGKAIAANYTPNTASAELYADDALAESENALLSASVAMETDDMTDDVLSTVFGHTVSDSILSVSIGDTAPEGVLGYYGTVVRNGVKKYIARVYGHARAQMGNENAQTKGSSITFQTKNVTFQCLPDPSTGLVYKQKTCDTEAAAKQYIDTECAVSP